MYLPPQATMVTRYCWNAHNEQGDCSFWGHSHNVDFPWETADIYCQFWALLQNGPFSYLSAKRLGSREWRNIQDLSSWFPQKKEYQGVATCHLSLANICFPQKKEYQGVATSKLVYKPDINDDGRYLACRVLPTSKTGKSLEDTWEIKVLCE